MGNYLSNNTLLLSAKRVFMRYNIENRAFKEIEKQGKKPLVAPKHDADAMDYHKSLKANTDYLSKTTAVDTNLDVRLKDVFVTSQGLTENIKSDKPLPTQRYTENFALGYKESVRVPPGKVTLMQAIDFISKHQSSPEVWTIERIANENKIKPDVASDIITHFRVFDFHMSNKVNPNELPNIKSDLKLLGAKNAPE